MLRQARRFGRWKESSNTHLTQDIKDRFKKQVDDNIDDKTRVQLEAMRKAQLVQEEKHQNDPNLWWNRINNMSERELDLLPINFLRKYGTFMHKIQENFALNKLEENWAYENRFEQVKNMKALETNEEK